jgi:ABC-type transport system involved in multi-copper enzyme maturation permease subunit
MGLLRTELFKLARHALPRWLGLVLLALVLLRGLAWPPDPNLPWAGLWSFQLVAVVLIMLTAVFTGMEFSEDTFRSLVSRGVPRWWLLLSKFTALVLVGGVFLVALEGLATLLGIRPQLHWGDLARAWLSLWPYVALIMLLTVLARNGGLAMVVGVLWVALEYTVGALMSVLATFSELPGWASFSPRGFLGDLFQWSLAFAGTNWTYLAEWQRAPVPTNVLLQAMPRLVLRSSLVLAVYALLGLGLSILVVYRRDMTEVVQGTMWRLGSAKRRARPVRGRARPRPDTLPMWTGKGPVLVRLVRADTFKTGRTSLVKIGAVVSLLFPLTLWLVARGLKATGFQDVLFSAGPEGGPPMAVSISLLLVGPLAAVVGILAVSNELTLGTRRAELARGVTRLQTIVGQSLALMLVLATGAYLGAAQAGGALTRSPLGAMVFGLGFLLADWLAILAPTLMIEEPGPLLELGRYAVFANTFGLASQGQIVGVGAEWQSLSTPASVLLLVGFAVGSHLLAALFSRMRDA